MEPPDLPAVASSSTRSLCAGGSDSSSAHITANSRVGLWHTPLSNLMLWHSDVTQFYSSLDHPSPASGHDSYPQECQQQRSRFATAGWYFKVLVRHTHILSCIASGCSFGYGTRPRLQILVTMELGYVQVWCLLWWTRVRLLCTSSNLTYSPHRRAR